jgi:hypothetical protein
MFYKDKPFILTTVVGNSGEATADNVSATISIDANASLAVGETAEKDLGSIAGDETIVVTWDLVAGTEEGYAIIKVQATGTGLRTATDYVMVRIDPPPTILLYEGANPCPYINGDTTVLPIALTNIIDEVEIIWQRDESTGGEWHHSYFYNGIWTGDITHLVNGHAYVVVVSQDIIWELPHH